MPGKLSLYIKCLYITKSCLFKYTENFTNKTWKFSDKKFWYTCISYFCSKYRLWALSQWGGSNEYLQSMFLSRNNKNNLYPYKPQFYCIKVGFKGVKIKPVFMMHVPMAVALEIDFCRCCYFFFFFFFFYNFFFTIIRSIAKCKQDTVLI